MTATVVRLHALLSCHVKGIKIEMDCGPIRIETFKAFDVTSEIKGPSWARPFV
jgi:hypothetical protein